MLLIGIAATLSLGSLSSKGIGAKRFAPLKVLFFDDFDAPELDRTKWNVIGPTFHVNNEQQAYVDDPRVLKIVHGRDAEGARHGALLIQGIYEPGFTSPSGRKCDFISGRIDTKGKAEFTYGRFSARVKMTAGDGLWPAFWALGNGRWPDSGEIDIMENVGVPTWASQAMHGPGYFGNTPLTHRADVDIAKWHIYSVDWLPDSLTFQIDGNTVYSVTRAMVEKYGRWAFDNPKHIIVNLALGGGYPQGVNHAREPYPGLPQSTVDLIKAGNGRYLVDWVKVEEFSGTAVGREE